jgi:chitinase
MADTSTTKLAGNFGQLKKLKAKYPNLKVVVSLGGWTYSKYFSDVAASDASRKKFVSSCIDMFIKGNLPVHDGVHGGTGVGAGIFDGVDIDWEYPGSPNGHLGNHYSVNDTANYTLLLAEFRTQLNALGGTHKLLTAALPGGADKIAKIETNKIAQYLDYGSVMTFDDHGGFWEPAGPTNHQTGLYTSPKDPMPPVPPGTQKYSVNDPVQSFIKGDPAYGIPGGFPANKLIIGYPMYYRGWTGVPAGSNHGLYGSATGPTAGYPLSGNVRGVAYYK